MNPELSHEIVLFNRLTDQFFLRLLIDIIFITILFMFIYFRIYKKKDFLFTFFLFNLIIFTTTYLLNKTNISVGAALGLFAVFSMLRYRTESIDTKDLTYMFIAIAIGLFCAVSNSGLTELIILNSLVVLGVYISDGSLILKSEKYRLILYENLELISKETYNEMILDLRHRTGLNIHKAKVEEINFERGFAQVMIYFYDRPK